MRLWTIHATRTFETEIEAETATEATQRSEGIHWNRWKELPAASPRQAFPVQGTRGMEHEDRLRRK